MNASVDKTTRGRGSARPGSMTMAMRAAMPVRASGPEVLRIGVLVSGRILEERVLPRTRVLVGSDERNDVVVRTSGIPSRLALFEPDGEGWIMHLVDGMRGRLAGGARAVDLEALRAQGVRTVRL